VIAGEVPSEAIRVEARIRHRHVPAAATVRVGPDRTATVIFDEPQRAITPGQSVVWYQGDLVIGGGVIARTR
jgi:tRNA-specific 2-thiouridylase